MKSIRHFLFLCTLVGTVVDSGQQLGAAENPEDIFRVLGTTVEEVNSFLGTLQKTVAESDVAGFADLVEFPLQVGMCDRERTIEGPRDLSLIYHELVNGDLRRAIISQKAQELFVNWQGMMMSSGQLWFTVLCDQESELGQCGNRRIRIIRINYSCDRRSGEEVDFGDRVGVSPAPALSMPMLIGSWIVTRYFCPGICGMSDREASSWVGRIMTVSEKKIVFGEAMCSSPEITVHEWSKDDFYRDWRFDFEKLGISGDEARTIEVSCSGKEWRAPGSLWVIRREGVVFLSWDGVFFEAHKRE